MTGFGPHVKRAQWRLVYRITSRGWWPTAVLIGMIAATPLPWRRRAARLVAGVLVLDALILARLAVMAVALFGASESVPVERWVRVMGPLSESFNSWVPPTVSVLFAFAVVASPSRTIDLRVSRTPLGRLLFGRQRRGAAASGDGVGDGDAGGHAEQGERDA